MRKYIGKFKLVIVLLVFIAATPTLFLVGFLSSEKVKAASAPPVKGERAYTSEEVKNGVGIVTGVADQTEPPKTSLITDALPVIDYCILRGWDTEKEAIEHAADLPICFDTEQQAFDYIEDELGAEAIAEYIANRQDMSLNVPIVSYSYDCVNYSCSYIYVYTSGANCFNGGPFWVNLSGAWINRIESGKGTSGCNMASHENYNWVCPCVYSLPNNANYQSLRNKIKSLKMY